MSDATATTAYIGLGSNCGDRPALVQSAIRALADAVAVVGASPLFESRPLGGPAQDDFCNAAVCVRTDRSARSLLDLCLAIEREHGRLRDAELRWGPRTLDLDLLLYGDHVIDEPGLRVPHPRLHARLFVLIPLAAIAPDLVHPVLDRSIHELVRERGGEAPDDERGVWRLDPVPTDRPKEESE